jgi:hypothetical protein
MHWEYSVGFRRQGSFQAQGEEGAEAAQCDQADQQRAAQAEAEQLPRGGGAEHARRLPRERARCVVATAQVIGGEVVHDRRDRRRVQHLGTREQHRHGDEEVRGTEGGGGERKRPRRRPEHRLEHQPARAAPAAHPGGDPELAEDDDERVRREGDTEDPGRGAADLGREGRKGVLDLAHPDPDEDEVDREDEPEAAVADDLGVAA